ncbi:hypothetical protein GGR53DRAFT_492921 [Hypoxylon sp. FL1150]|nr:hypothetical protein GGR53DRAFT_492921 [Hypoxylon sp. FL1150]
MVDHPERCRHGVTDQSDRAPGLHLCYIFQWNSKLGRVLEPIACIYRLAGGRAYQFASDPYIHNFEPRSQSEVLDVYLQATKVVWYGAMAFGASGLIAVAVEKHVPLRTELETDYGLQEREKGKASGSMVLTRGIHSTQKIMAHRIRRGASWTARNKGDQLLIN